MYFRKVIMMYTIEELQKLITNADAIVIGAGAGLSASAGFEYGGKTFLKNFKYMFEKFGYTDMYQAGFHHFSSEEEKWAYWAKMIDLNRYEAGAMPLYKQLLELVKQKNYFVITTNVDHQFQLAGFDKTKLFYMQGDYGLFQCSKACHNKTYDNENDIKQMLESIKDNRVSKNRIPLCPICGAPMTTNLRCNDSFVEDEGWHDAQKRFISFINENKNKNILLLELGVGFSTPVWIKYPFLKLTWENPKARYVIIDKGYSPIPKEIQSQTLVFKEDIAKIVTELCK